MKDSKEVLDDKVHCLYLDVRILMSNNHRVTKMTDIDQLI